MKYILIILFMSCHRQPIEGTLIKKVENRNPHGSVLLYFQTGDTIIKTRVFTRNWEVGKYYRIKK